jgi:hypothetical protein
MGTETGSKSFKEGETISRTIDIERNGCQILSLPQIGGKKMKGSKLFLEDQHQEAKMKAKRNNHWNGLVVFISVLLLGVLLTSCNLNGEAGEPTGTPEPSVTPDVLTGSIHGLVWEDLCENYDQGDSIPSGCVALDDGMSNVANGILDAGETGIPSVQVYLGTGVCPSEGLAVTETDSAGKFSFSGLEKGIYCVTVKDPARTLGVWTYPKSDQGEGVGYITVAVGDGSRVENVNFGRDHITAPPTAEPTVAPTPLPCVDQAEFVRDVTIPDGTRVDPGKAFFKTWRLRNSGTCTWTPEYSIVFVSGSSMQSAKVVSLPGQVPAGSEVDLTLQMQAPTINGDYEGFWKLRNGSGSLFGIGENGNSPFWVWITVGPKPEPKITDWRGEYYANTKLSGEYVLVRNDKEIDFNWGNGSPDDDVPSDGFSARWTREVTFEKALYRFHLVMDDGAALWVDDRLVIDEWKQGASREVTVDLELKKGDHEIKLEYFEAGGTARMNFWWEKLTNVSFEGWKGSYWFNKTLDSKWALVRDDKAIDFNWVFKSPVLGIPEDQFSIRWEKEVDFDDGVYAFYARADDGFRFYLDEALVIDEWHISNASELYSVELELDGSHELTIEYYEGKQHAKVNFWWEQKNEAPVAMDDEYTVDTGTELNVDAPGVLENDSDADEDALSALLVTDVVNGSLTLNKDGSFLYAPNADFTGVDGFEYRVTDGLEESNLAKVKIVVEPLNYVPEAVDDVVSTHEETPVDINVLENDLGLGDTPLELTILSEPESGTVEIIENQVRYSPEEGFIGDDTFSYEVIDVDGESSTAVVTITVVPKTIEP